MGVIKEMIIFEDRLAEMFADLPDMVSLSGNSTHKVTFGYGDGKELNVFLKQKEKGDSPYPLVWLLYPYAELQTNRNMSVGNVSLILAVNTNTSMQNKERIDETYKKLLIPLYNNIVHLFRRSNIVNTDSEYNVVKHPNYSDDTSTGEGHFANGVWDAMKVTFSMTVIDTCYKNVNF